MTIHFLTKADLAVILSIESQVNPAPWSLKDFENSLSAGHAGFVMSSSDNIIGYAIISAVLDEAELLLIGIAPEYQHQGLGSKLFKHIQVYLNEKNITKMFLEVRESNTKALSFYKKMGFVEITRRLNYYQCADGREDAVVMRVNGC